MKVASLELQQVSEASTGPGWSGPVGSCAPHCLSRVGGGQVQPGGYVAPPSCGLSAPWPRLRGGGGHMAASMRYGLWAPSCT